uniref:Uncharacterized protein n=1 Tax=Romanomermis culicivorax TaxID=13658 RepID=A0A915ITC1_ROMCU
MCPPKKFLATGLLTSIGISIISQTGERIRSAQLLVSGVQHRLLDVPVQPINVRLAKISILKREQNRTRIEQQIRIKFEKKWANKIQEASKQLEMEVEHQHNMHESIIPFQLPALSTPNWVLDYKM